MKTEEMERILQLGRQFIDDEEKYQEFKLRIEALYSLSNPTAEEIADLFGEVAAQFITKKLLRNEDKELLAAVGPLAKMLSKVLIRPYVEQALAGGSVKKITPR